MASTRSVRPTPTAEIAGWDAEADVVVVGYGVAGAAAAGEAAAAGADTLVLEWTGGWGGAAALAGGFIYLGGGTAVQKACGFADTPQEMYKFLMAAMGPGADPAKVGPYCEHSVAHFDWLTDIGVRFNPTFYDQPGSVPGADEGLMYSGGENAWPFYDIAVPAPRGHLPALPPGATRIGERGGGYYLMEPLVRRATELGVRAEFGVRADALCVESDGRIAGVVATRFGRPWNVRARRGVMLAAGGFTYNDDMVGRFAPEVVTRYGAAIEQHDGHAIRMAQAVGADLGRMDGAEVTPGLSAQLIYRGIMVNGLGQRFVTEDTYPGRIGQAILYRADGTAYLLIDQRAYEAAPASPHERTSGPNGKPVPTWLSESLPELESLAALPAGSLESTVSLYNRHAARREDPVLHKTQRWIAPLESPYGLFDLRQPRRAFSLGGLRTDPHGRVLHVAGEPIPGLYAAGRCASGIPVWGYASGTSLGDGSFFGRRAGRAAAADG
jgi:3-oxo-5alpha-steroid 4-dehydrogenase